MLRTRLVAGVTSGVVLSAVFATALTVVAFADALVEPWRVQPGEPAPITLRLPRTTLRAYDPATDTSSVVATSRTVAHGEVITDPTLSAFVKAYEQSRRPPRATHVAAQWLVYFVLMLVAAAYMRRISAKNGALLRTQVALFALAFAFLFATKILLLTTNLPALIFPVAIVPLWASLYVDRRTGSMTAVLLSLFTSSLIVYDPIVSVVYLIISCLAALSFKHATRKRNAFLIASGVLAGMVGAFAYVATKEIFDGFDLEHELQLTWRSGPLATLISGLLAGVGAFVLQPAASRLVGAVSRSQLLLLTDLEQPLLKRMSTSAPGSWEHSRAMANLAEASAAAIGADALLTRVGAYYHDLGKTVQAKYFIENLSRGERSPHEDLEPDVSADSTLPYAVEGTRILREGRIP